MKKILITLSFAIQFIFAQSPGFTWTAACNGVGGNDFGLATATDAQGNVYSTGAFKYTVDFDPGPGFTGPSSAGLNDLYIQKLSPTGTLIWVVNIGGSGEEIGRAISIDAAGNILVTGNFTTGTVDFNPGPAVNNLTCAGNSDVFILKLSPAGNFIWAKSIGGSYDDMGYSICSDANSNVFIGGDFNGTVDFDPSAGVFNMSSVSTNLDAFVLKLDASGNYAFAKQFGGVYNSTTYGVRCNQNGDVGVVGTFSWNIDLDPGPGVDSVYAGILSGFFSQLDNNGNYLHGHSNNGAPYYALQFDVNNHMVVTGYSVSYVDLDPGPATVYTTPNANNDAFVARFRPNGNFVWGKSIAASGWENGFAIDVDGVGNVISVGNFSGTGDFDPGPGTQTVTSNGNYDIYIHKFDTAGNFLWNKQIGGAGDDQPKGISIDPFGNIGVSGYYNGTVDFDPGAGTANSISGGGSDIYTVKFQCLSTSSSVNITSCGNYTSPSGNYTWTINGNYIDTITNRSGCDSIMSINLTILSPSSSTITQNSCGSFSSPSGNYVWNTSGTFQDTIPNYVGCDSIITINLSVTNIDTNITISNGIFSVAQNGATYQWFDCIAAAIIPGETNQSFTPTANGSFGLLISYNGCADTTSCYSIMDVGLESNNELNKIKIYPNPSYDYLQIDSKDLIIGWSITDMTGKSIIVNPNLANSKETIHIYSLDPGNYILEIKTINGIYKTKFIKL